MTVEILTKIGANRALTHVELDGNFIALRDAINIIQASSGGSLTVFATEHAADGTHTDITGSSIDITTDANVGGTLDVVGDVKFISDVDTPSMTLGGVQRFTWPDPGSASQAIDDVLANGDTSVRAVRLNEYTINGVFATLPSLAYVDAVISLGKDDPDGGAWINKTRHTSWYSETRTIGEMWGSYADATTAVAAGAVTGDYYYNTTNSQFEEITAPTTSSVTYRAGTAEFPQDRLVTAETGRVIIWDITKGNPTMWMVFNGGGGKAVYVLADSVDISGHIIVSGAPNVGGLGIIDFVADTQWLTIHNTNEYNRDSIANRNANTVDFVSGVTTPIVNRSVNDVAITILPDAPLDVHGMRIPTIYVASDGGMNRIASDGGVSATATTSTISEISIRNSNIYAAISGTATPYININAALPTGGASSLQTYWGRVTGAAWAAAYIARPASNITVTSGSDHAGISGMARIAHNVAEGGASMGAAITNAYNTGYMVGDIRRAFLANSKTIDRSVKGGTLVEVGTVTETVNSGGRNVYSGFSATNYFSEASHADWNALGTGDFDFLMCGVKWGTSGTTRNILTLGDGVSNGSLLLQINASDSLLMYVYNTGSFGAVVISTQAMTDTDEHTVEFKRNGTTISIVVDGIVIATGTSALSISNATGSLFIGEVQHTSNPWGGGQCACVRISATAPTAEQSKFIAAQENALNGGALCLLSNSASVSALAYDESSDVLSVGNGTNIDEFVGLQRISSAAHGTGTLAAILSGYKRGGSVGASGGSYYSEDRNIDTELTAAQAELNKYKQGTVSTVLTSDGGSVLTFPQGFKPMSVISTAGTIISLSVNIPKFDGFIWFLDSGVAASTAYDVQMARI